MHRDVKPAQSDARRRRQCSRRRLRNRKLRRDGLADDDRHRVGNGRLSLAGAGAGRARRARRATGTRWGRRVGASHRQAALRSGEPDRGGGRSRERSRSRRSLPRGLPRELDPVFERALAKDPQRYSGRSEFVAASARPRFADAAGTTRELAAVPRTRRTAPGPTERAPAAAPARSAWPLLARCSSRRRRGALLAYFLTRDDSPHRPDDRGHAGSNGDDAGAGHDGREAVTVTTSPSQQRRRPHPVSPERRRAEPRRLRQDAGRRLRGSTAIARARGAEAAGHGLTRRGVRDYNLAFTRFQLGNCDGVLELLDRSEAIQGQRSEIDRLRKQAQEAC